jgi:prophage maintenance system killer protein
MRLKKDIKKISSPLEKILQLNGYTFNWKKDGRADMGVIAQEVEKVFPNIV